MARTIAKDKFITKAGLLDIAAIPILRDIYNEFARIRYTIINTLTPIDKVLLELVDNNFFSAYEVSGDRLRCVFFVYP